MDYFKGTHSIVDLLVDHVPNPKQNNANKLA